jgi:V8-like Glu-specific endopeptidase
MMLGLNAQAYEIYNKVQKYNLEVRPAHVQNLRGNDLLKKVIEIPKAQGLRLHFNKKLRLGKGNAIRITSYEDGKQIKLNDQRLAQFNYATPYMNGNKLLLEVYVPNLRNYQGLQVRALETPYLGASRTICGKDDDRLPSKFSPMARMMKTSTGSGGCTATMISENCMISAGHCSSYLNIAQFNVPPSKENGKVNYPGPEDQYPLSEILAFKNNGIGRDWAVYRLKPNPVTNRMAGEVYGYIRVKTEPVANNSQLVITGYGVDNNDPTRNLAQQMHTGLLLDNGEGDAGMKYRVDTMGGNSGSGVIEKSTGALVGVHTHGGCNSSSETSGNAGTSLAYNEAFKAAVVQCLNQDRALRSHRK